VVKLKDGDRAGKESWSHLVQFNSASDGLT
jgi:hypothetical protein